MHRDTLVLPVLCSGADIDYESWTSHFDNSLNPQFKGCLLGRRETFMRLKKDSWWVDDVSTVVVTHDLFRR